MGGTLHLPMAGKMLSHSSVQMVTYVKEMTLKPIYYSVLILTHILNMTNVTFQAIYKIFALSVLIHYGMIGMGLSPVW